VSLFSALVRTCGRGCVRVLVPGYCVPRMAEYGVKQMGQRGKATSARAKHVQWKAWRDMHESSRVMSSVGEHADAAVAGCLSTSPASVWLGVPGVRPASPAVMVVPAVYAVTPAGPAARVWGRSEASEASEALG
jgi:hypothetical protein